MSQTEVIQNALAKVSDADVRKIHECVKRASASSPLPFDAVSLELDLTVVHATVGLKLDQLLAADNFNFVHDINGISRHLNRETGELEDFFLPRFAKPEEQAA